MQRLDRFLLTAWIVAGLGALVLASQGIAAEAEKTARVRPLVGAIRWDAW